MGRLTFAAIKRATRPGLHGDGGTLYLYVGPGGGKSWIQRITVDGRRRDIGLGGWPLVSLREARDQAFENRRRVFRGEDPRTGRQARGLTFGQAAERAIEAARTAWRNGRTAADWRRQLELYAGALRDRPVAQIKADDVLRVLGSHWTERPSVARKLRQRIRAILAWAQAHGHVEGNAADERIDAALPAPPAVKSHHRALPFGEVPTALAAVEKSAASVMVKACMAFVVLTACRSGEARGATWGEIDTEARTWTIPAERMKSAREHRVPLSDAALAAVERMRPFGRGPDSLVFPSPQRARKPIGHSSLNKLLTDLGVACVVHGFRSSFRTWAAERTDVAPDVAEAALSHAVGGAVERSYARSDLFAKRRALMDDWAAFLAG